MNSPLIDDDTRRLAYRIAGEVQAAALAAINTVDEPHEGSYKAVRDLNVDAIALRVVATMI